MHTIAVIAYEGISPFHLSVPCILFGDDLRRLEVPRYRVLICGERVGLVATMSGFNIEVCYGLETIAQADTVIVPAWRDPDERPSDRLLAALRDASRRGARIVGFCLGAFVLAEAGLLDGRQAATHWAWSEDFARKYPRVFLDRNALYVEDGGVMTSAGTAAAIDCCLQMIRRDHGMEVAKRLARRLVVAPQRQGGQAQYIEQPLTIGGGTDALCLAMDWALQHLAQPLDIASLAARAGMSRRNFTRRFKEKTGTTLAQWLLTHRLAAAQRLLETGSKSMDRIAEQAGFRSTVSFRQQFSRAFSIPPGAYRKLFGQPLARDD